MKKIDNFSPSFLAANFLIHSDNLWLLIYDMLSGKNVFTVQKKVHTAGPSIVRKIVSLKKPA